MSQFKQYKHNIPMTDDTEWTGVVPAGYQLESIVFFNSTANEAILDLGTSASGVDVFDQQAIVANGITTVMVNKTFSMLARQSLYLSDDGVGTWNSASLTAILSMRSVML